MGERRSPLRIPMVDAAFDRLTSARLLLRRFRADDIAAFVRYRADAEVARFQSWENFTAEDGERFYEWGRTRHPDIPGEWFQVAVALRDSDAIIGDCGLHALADPADAMEIGFTLAPEHHRRGYASEAVACLLDYVFGRLGKSRAVAITDVRNARSIAVLERLGFARDPAPRAPVLFKGEACEEYLYSLERADWASRSQRCAM
jgi:RimJ/RimL family protein N-acetyltransferase